VTRTALFLALTFAALAGHPLRAADQATEEQARERYESAFEPGLQLQERTDILESVAKDYADTRWADDALWVLGEVASRSGDLRRAILFRRQLLERDRMPELEPYTRSRWIYRHSRVPGALYVLEHTGHAYTAKGIRAVPFNPIPMLTCEALAQDYERLGLLELAYREYRRAAAAAPQDGLFSSIYEARAERLRRRIELIRKCRETARQQHAAAADATEPASTSGEDVASAPPSPADGQNHEQTAAANGGPSGD